MKTKKARRLPEKYLVKKAAAKKKKEEKVNKGLVATGYKNSVYMVGPERRCGKLPARDHEKDLATFAFHEVMKNWIRRRMRCGGYKPWYFSQGGSASPEKS